MFWQRTKGIEEDETRSPGKKLDVQTALQDGSFVAVHSRLRRSAGDPEIAVVHIFRFENGRIAELWDIAQVAPKQIVNENGMFWSRRGGPWTGRRGGFMNTIAISILKGTAAALTAVALDRQA